MKEFILEASIGLCFGFAVGFTFGFLTYLINWLGV